MNFMLVTLQKNLELFANSILDFDIEEIEKVNIEEY